MIDEGSVFGKLKVVSGIEIRNTHRYYKVVCECGVEKFVFGQSLKKGRSKSCGCARAELFINSQKKTRQFNRDGGEIKTIGFKNDRAAHLYQVAFRNSIRDRGSFSGSDLSFHVWKSLVDSPCHYCGTLGSNKKADYSSGKRLVSNKVIAINGIDRVDSTLPYVASNCVPCCKICNIMKSNLTVNEFLDHVKKIYERQT